MKAVYLTDIREMEIRDIPEPDLKNSTDVLIKVGTVGVCGSDVHYYTTGRIGNKVVEYPFIVGHEFAGTVQETGADVKHIKKGDRVAVDPGMACGKCDQCLANRKHTCRNLRFLGCPGQVDGCLREYIVIPEECCFPVSESITLEQAVLAEPLSIGLYALKLSMPIKGKSIAILGAGPIGLSVLVSALAEGAEKIYVTDKIDTRLNAAQTAGAVWTGNPDKIDIVEEIIKHEPSMLDVVFECCGQQDALDQAVSILKPGGKLLIIGIPETDRISFSPHEMRQREICVQNVRRQNNCVSSAINMIESGKTDIDFMITHRFELNQTKEAFDLVSEYADGVIKAVVEIG
ncbi:zinc-binding dehydrogenase [Verrucomicrobiota bacterium]